MRLRTTLTTISSRLRSRPTPRDKPIPCGTSFQLTLYDLVKQMLATHPSWQVRDESGRWVCPYCCELTPVEINGPIGATTLHQIAGYIGLCSGFDEHKHVFAAFCFGREPAFPTKKFLLRCSQNGKCNCRCIVFSESEFLRLLLEE